MTEVIGWTATVLIMVSYLPQAYQVWKTKSVDDISLYTYLILFTSAVLWGIYGYLREDAPIIFTNVVLGIVQLYIIVLKLKYQKK